MPAMRLASGARNPCSCMTTHLGQSGRNHADVFQQRRALWRPVNALGSEPTRPGLKSSSRDAGRCLDVVTKDQSDLQEDTAMTRTTRRIARPRPPSRSPWPWCPPRRRPGRPTTPGRCSGRRTRPAPGTPWAGSTVRPSLTDDRHQARTRDGSSGRTVPLVGPEPLRGPLLDVGRERRVDDRRRRRPAAGVHAQPRPTGPTCSIGTSIGSPWARRPTTAAGSS